TALADARTPDDLLHLLVGGGGGDRAWQSPVPTATGPLSGFPATAATLVEVLEWHAERHPERAHVLLYGDGEGFTVSSPETITYAALLTTSKRVASGLVSRGLRPRQAVALMLPTGRDYLCGFFGVLFAGGIPVPIYPPARLAQIDDHLRRHAHILANAETVFVVTVPQGKGVAGLLRAKVPSLTEILTCADLDSEPIDLLYRPAPDDIAFLQYTSGSTGDPKGVMLSHANLLANLRAMGDAAEIGGDDVFVSWLPLYHDMGLIGAWFGSLYFGMRLVLMSPLAFLARPARWLQAISHHRGTLSAAPNFAYDLCARKLADADLAGLDLSSWRLAFNGAEPVNPATLAAFAERYARHGFAAESLAPVYGLAECSVGLAFPPLRRGPHIDLIDREALTQRRQAVPVGDDSLDPVRVTACGRALPGHAIRVVDDRDAELPDRHVGRLQFKGPSVTAGYFRNPVATRSLFHGEWLDSGDSAYLVDGEIYLTGRAKDLIIRGGRNLYPYELEQAVGNIAGVRRGCVAVFASNDPCHASERLVVVAETRADDPRIRETLRREINQAAIDTIGLPADEIVLAPPNAVLKTSSGKIRRNATRALFESGSIGVQAAGGRGPMFRLGLATLRVRLGDAARRFGGMAYACWCWSVLLTIGLPVAAITLVLQWPVYGRYLVHFAARLILFLTGLPVRETENNRFPDVPHLLLINHCSYFDGLALCAALPPRHAYRFVAKREFIAQPLIHAFLKAVGTVFVERFSVSKSVEDVEDLTEELKNGGNLAIFPEGTFSREAGLKAFRMGAFVVAARAGVPVLVGGLRGTRQVLPDKTWMPRFGEVAFNTSAPLFPEGNDWRAAIGLRDLARREMLRLCGEHDLDR
ncbi:MAG TPA: AMP-binding protein, partial [Accumulibacter sp.]|nr:AMP-binding protein [Accumulibacter sp.]